MEDIFAGRLNRPRSISPVRGGFVKKDRKRVVFPYKTVSEDDSVKGESDAPKGHGIGRGGYDDRRPARLQDRIRLIGGHDTDKGTEGKVRRRIGLFEEGLYLVRIMDLLGKAKR